METRRPRRCGRHLAFVGWGVFWGLFDGALAGALIGGVASLFVGGLSIELFAEFLLGVVFGTLLGAVVGALAGLLVGAGLGAFAACRWRRGLESSVIAELIPDAATMLIVVGSAVIAVFAVIRSHAAHESSDFVLWAFLLVVVAAAIVLGRLSSFAIARWYTEDPNERRATLR